MDALRKLTGYSSPSAQQAAAEAAVAEELEGDVLLGEAGNDSAGLGPGPGALSIRAPISADDADLVDGNGEGSFGSGESFDSALERMAASSSASLEAGSPVGSFHEGGSPLHELFGHHHHHHHRHAVHHDGSEGPGLVVVGNGNGPAEGVQVMPVAKLTAEDELLEDEGPEDSAEDTVEENGDEYEEAEGGEDVAPSEDEEDVYPRVTAEGLPVRVVDDDYLQELAPQTVVQQHLVLEESKVVDAGKLVTEPEAVVEDKEEKNLEKVLEKSEGEAVSLRKESDSALEGELPQADWKLDGRAVLEGEDEGDVTQLEGSADLAALVHGAVLPSRGNGDALSLSGLEPAVRVSSSQEEDGAPPSAEPSSTTEAVQPNEEATDVHEETGEKLVSEEPEDLDAEKGDAEPEAVVSNDGNLETKPEKVVAVSGGVEADSVIEELPNFEDDIPLEGSTALVHVADSCLRQNGDAALLSDSEPSLPAFPAGLSHSEPSLEPAAVASSTEREGGAALDFPVKDHVAENDVTPKDHMAGNDIGPEDHVAGNEDVPEDKEAERVEDVPQSKDKKEVHPVNAADGLPVLVGHDDYPQEVAATTVLQHLVSEEPKVLDAGKVPEDVGKVLEEPTVLDVGKVSEDARKVLEEPKVLDAGKAEAESGEVVDNAENLERKPEKLEVDAVSVGAEPDSVLEVELPPADLNSSSPAGLEEEEEDEDEDDILIERSAALAALVHGADSTSRGNGDAPSLGAAGPSLPARPAGLGRSVPSLEPAPRSTTAQRGGGAAPSAQSSGPTEENLPNGEANDGHEETREKLQLIRVKFLRLAHRLGQSAHNVVVAQVLYRLGLAEQLRGGRSSGRSGAFSFDRASAIAEEQEAAGEGELDFTCTIMLLGKTGVGKSATINSIFDEVKTVTNAFSPATRKVQEIIGKVHGIKVRVIDTPGLLPSVSDQRQNEKVMSSVKSFIKKSPPDIVLYFDRLDMQSRDYGDLPLLRTITDTFGPAVWFNAIVVLTHAASAPPDGPNGQPLSYEMFVAQRSHVVQQTIRHAAGDMRLMNPVSLVENHPACRTNRAGQRVLPNGQIWKPQLLLLCFASKILAEANSLLKLQDNVPGRPFGSRQRVPPLPFLLSSLLQSRQQLKMMDDQGGEEDESDDELDEEDNSDDETEFDQLPPFRRLTKEEVLELDDQQRKEYSQELADRERLFQKKQWREELRRRKEMKKRLAAVKEQLAEEAAEDEGARSAAVPVPLPDMVLPPSFDSDSPTHRYRYLEAPNQWLVRPVLETHGWDHDSGYDGFSVEKSFAVYKKFPAQVSGQITKDKKETNLTMECAASFKHGEGKVTLSGLDIQTIGKDLAYTLRSETRFSNFKQNKTTGGLALTLLGDTIAAGLKLENRLLVGKRLKLVVNGGALTGKGDVAYGGSLEATLRDKDYPFSRTLSTLGLSIMDWHGDLAIGGNLQSQFLLGKTMISARANLNNRGAGQISIRASSSEQLQMALIGIIPIIRAVFSSKLFGSSQPGQ